VTKIKKNVKTFFYIYTMNHIVDTCPLTKFEGGLNLVHEADDDAAIWLESRATAALATYKQSALMRDKRRHSSESISVDMNRTKSERSLNSLFTIIATAASDRC